MDVSCLHAYYFHDFRIPVGTILSFNCKGSYIHRYLPDYGPTQLFISTSATLVRNKITY